MRKQEVPEGTRIFGSPFVGLLMKIGDSEIKKSRLVPQDDSNTEGTENSTKAPTIQRFSQRLMIAASMKGTNKFTRHVTQAYVQSQKPLERGMYRTAPTEMNLPQDAVLKVLKPLYVIPESGLHWYLTYLEYHVEKLEMVCATVDPCMLTNKHEEGRSVTARILQVDDCLAFGDEEFMIRRNVKQNNSRASHGRCHLKQGQILTAL